jgi:leucyl-tRNA synthetase
MASLGFNTAIAKLIELNNRLTRLDLVPREVAEALVLMVAPLAPHIGEELWSMLRGPSAATVAYESFPSADPAWLVEETVEVPVMIRGKVRAKINVSPSADAKALEKAALEDPRVQEHLAGLEVKKVIAIPARMVNIVV